MSHLRIATLPGDGIGPEVTEAAIQVMRAVEATSDDLDFRIELFSVGAGEYRASGDPLPRETLTRMCQCDAILLGAMGLPNVRWPNGTEMAPQIDIREELDLYQGIRPVRLYQDSLTPLKGKSAGEIDFVLFRENTEGLFWERKKHHNPGADSVENAMRVTRRCAERIVKAAFGAAEQRRKKVTLVDKANVLPAMAFFRAVFDEVAEDYPGIETERMYVDAAALHLVRQPESFDVLVTENMFGDILSDLAAGIVGGMGMAPSADIGDTHAVFQPAHGSAPDIAGKGIANPLAAILSAAMMLEWLGLPEHGAGISNAVARALEDPDCRTADLGGKISCAEMTQAVLDRL